mmetsp:Transcript_62818/g.178446  ORF Transcript_62818/g.178446 Transcript_62818/m.178446 type:complete len:486 (-) Transcript_62818:375-1832(-)
MVRGQVWGRADLRPRPRPRCGQERSLDPGLCALGRVADHDRRRRGRPRAGPAADQRARSAPVHLGGRQHLLRGLPPRLVPVLRPRVPLHGRPVPDGLRCRRVLLCAANVQLRDCNPRNTRCHRRALPVQRGAWRLRRHSRHAGVQGLARGNDAARYCRRHRGGDDLVHARVPQVRDGEEGLRGRRGRARAGALRGRDPGGPGDQLAADGRAGGGPVHVPGALRGRKPEEADLHRLLPAGRAAAHGRQRLPGLRLDALRRGGLQGPLHGQRRLELCLHPRLRGRSGRDRLPTRRPSHPADGGHHLHGPRARRRRPGSAAQVERLYHAGHGLRVWLLLPVCLGHDPLDLPVRDLHNGRKGQGTWISRVCPVRHQRSRVHHHSISDQLVSAGHTHYLRDVQYFQLHLCGKVDKRDQVHTPGGYPGTLRRHAPFGFGVDVPRPCCSHVTRVARRPQATGGLMVCFTSTQQPCWHVWVGSLCAPRRLGDT